jgi:hypothetical protein
MNGLDLMWVYAGLAGAACGVLYVMARIAIHDALQSRAYRKRVRAELTRQGVAP